MNVGQNLMGGLVQVGNGQASIDVAGSVIATEQRTTLRQKFENSAYLQLAIDDAQLSLQAGGSVNLRGVSSMLGVNDRAIWLSTEYDTERGPQWLGYTEDTSVRITSLGGDINYFTQGANTINVLPSQVAFVATAGSINLGVEDAPADKVIVDMWHDTRVDLLAKQNINFRLPDNYDGGGFTIGFSDPTWVPRAINPYLDGFGVGLFANAPVFDGLTGNWFFNQAGPGFGIDGENIHSGSDSYSRIYAAEGDMIGWRAGTFQQDVATECTAAPSPSATRRGSRWAGISAWERLISSPMTGRMCQ